MKKSPRSFAVSLSSGLVVALLFIIFDYIEAQRYRETLHTQTISQLSQVRAELEAGINGNFFLTRGLLAFISAYPDIKQDTFHRLADHLLQYPNFIRNIALAPDNSIAFVHPVAGNQQALGLNYEQNEQQWPTVKKVIESRKTIIAGPVELVQGGSAFISRTPIYTMAADGGLKSRYWGLASIVIDKQRLLESAGFFDPQLQIRIALRGADGLGAQGTFIAGERAVFQNDPALLAVHLPEGSWQLAAVPLAGWGVPSPYRKWIRGSGLLFSLLTGLTLFAWQRHQLKTRHKIEAALGKAQLAEDQLIFTNTILTSQMEASLDGILVVDDQEKILSFNRRFVDIWQLPDKILQTKSDKLAIDFILKSLDDPDAFLEKLEHLYSSKEEQSRDQILLKDGRILDRYSTPLIGPDGTFFGRTWYFRDITEQTRMELELQKGKKLESIGVLAGGIAHDFNNILAAILGNLNLAVRRSKGDERVLPLLKGAEKASLRAKGLTQQLLTFSKGGEPVKKVISMKEVIRDSADFVLRGTNVRCEFDFADQLNPAEVDPGQIGQAIQNIVLNARHAMPDGGIVKIACRNINSAQESACYLDKGDYLKISIADSGCGIPADQLDKIFDPYFTTKPGGSGLGLAITHSIISKHKGRINAESLPGKGTTFTLCLPAYADGSVAQQPETGWQPEKGSGLILLMDDDAILRSVVREMLEDSGYQVLQAADGREALDIYQQSASPIAAVIMDLTIPGGMGGVEAVKKLLAIDPAAKVIVSSGYSHDPIMANYQQYGFCGAIEKPYQWQNLEELLQKIL